ncbi:MAG: DUF4956 domain-containing protein [Ardenticatenaceae bacterium]|nr:DUF4956 domain-containing protein [Ardenticatenaceae bacterium]
MEEFLNLTESAPLSLTTLSVNLILTLLLGTSLAWFYAEYGRSFSNRSKLAQVLPIIAVTTALIISVVKSSLALSLGLVGALSIIRFRTAIKEPEELAYLFIAIAIGLGMGADHRLTTIIAFLIILGYMFVRTLSKLRPQKNNLYLNIQTADQETGFAQINEVLKEHVTTADLRRLDHTIDSLHATYLINCPDDQTLTALMDALRQTLPGSEFSFIEQENTLAG